MSHKFLKTQLELGIGRNPEHDRNYHLGGRSFYFFDFDDNIAFLTTPLYIFHKKTGAEVALSSADFAKHHSSVGVSGVFEDFRFDYCDVTGSFRNFRDKNIEALEKLEDKRQVFVRDVADALGFPDFQWKGPSWECFYHAAFNQRPVSLITARGHHPETIKQGIKEFVFSKALPLEPNYLSIYPVSHKPTRVVLGDLQYSLNTAELKQRAIRASVQAAIQKYGYSPHHRFGMSDDDPKNIQLIVEEMARLKAEYPEMSFFIIETDHGNFNKREITADGLLPELKETVAQLSFFEGGPKSK